MAETVEKLNEICPYATQSELDFERDVMAKKLAKGSKIVMIGAGPGVLLISLLEGIEHTELNATVIDIDSVQWIKAHITMNTILNSAFKITDRIKYIEGFDSYDIGMGWKEKIDYLIIDGDHTERGIKRDMEAWLDHVKIGGHVFFHDYLFKNTRWDEMGREIYPEVQPFVDKEMKKRKWKLFWRGGCSAVFEVK